MSRVGGTCRRAEGQWPTRQQAQQAAGIEEKGSPQPIRPHLASTHAAPRIKQVVQRTLDLPDQPPIARQGQACVREQLTSEALHCYWLGALQRYAEIYYLPRTPAQEAASGGGTSVV